jgi:integrase
MQSNDIANELRNISASFIKLATLFQQQNDFANNDNAGIDNNNATMGNRLKIQVIKKGDNQSPSKEEINLQRGSITKRSDGRYMGRYYDTDKKQKSVYGKTKQECFDKLKQVIKELETREDNTRLDKTMLLNNWFEYFVKMFRKNVVKESTLINEVNNYNANIKDTLGVMPISKITPLIVKEFVENQPTKHRRQYCYGELHELYEKMVAYGLVKKNIMDLFALTNEDKNKSFEEDIDEDDEEKVREKYIPAEHRTIIFNALRKNEKGHQSIFYYVAMIMYYTGMRAGEAIGLYYKDFLYDTNQVRINKAFNRTTQKMSSTKTEAGDRYVPFFDATKAILEEMQKDHKFLPNERIFKNINPRSFTETLRKTSKRYTGVTYSPHDLRHTFVTNCLEAGADPQTVAKWVGHKSVKVTLSTYAHVSPEKEQSQKELMNNNFTLKLSN